MVCAGKVWFDYGEHIIDVGFAEEIFYYYSSVAKEKLNWVILSITSIAEIC